MLYTVDLTSWIVVVWFAGFCLSQMWSSYLSWREKSFVLSHEKTAAVELQSLHACAKDFFTQDKLDKSIEYERASDCFGAFRGKMMRLLSVSLMMFGAFPCIFDFFSSKAGLSFALSFIVSEVLVSLMCTLVSIPFSYYSNFSLEERFGFNRMEKKTFWTDILKNEMLSAMMTCIIISLFYALVELIHCFYGRIDWVSALVVAAVASFGSMLYEMAQLEFVMPMFNEFSPLEDGTLKTRAERLLRELGYDPAGVYIIDASKRTAHSNAYCTGWGKSKKLVLFDTLLKSFTEDEVIAILGHELAHSKLKHLVINRAIDFMKGFAFIFFASMLVYSPNVYNSFGWNMVNSSNVMGFALVGFFLAQELFSSVTWVFDGLESYVSRLMEFAADGHSCLYTKMHDSLVTALFKLYGENLSFPLSDSLFEAWNFSHPSLVNRVRAIARIESMTKADRYEENGEQT